MNIGEYGFEKSDFLMISEEMYDLKCRKSRLELELSNTQFHYRYITKRKNLLMNRLFIYLACILADTYVIFAICNNPSMINLFLILLPFLLFGDYKMAIKAFKMLLLLSNDLDIGIVKKLIQILEVDTLQYDRTRTEEIIKEIQNEMQVCDNRYQKLLTRKQEMIQRKRQDELEQSRQDKDSNESKSSLMLKETDLWSNDIQVLDEYYRNQQSYLVRVISRIQTQIDICNKDITTIASEFQQAKKILCFAGIIFVLVVLIQSRFEGLLLKITSILCIIVSILVIMYLEKICKGPILRYMVEQENELISDYAFTHGMLPVSALREQYMDSLREYEKEIEEVKQKRRELDEQG